MPRIPPEPLLPFKDDHDIELSFHSSHERGRGSQGGQLSGVSMVDMIGLVAVYCQSTRTEWNQPLFRVANMMTNASD
eukprot:358238-Rhodomonas_salina.2